MDCLMVYLLLLPSVPASVILQSTAPENPLQPLNSWTWGRIKQGKVFVADRDHGNYQGVKLPDLGDEPGKQKRVLDVIDTALNVLEEEFGVDIEDEIENVIEKKAVDRDPTISTNIEDFSNNVEDLGVQFDDDASVTEILEIEIDIATEAQEDNEYDGDINETQGQNNVEETSEYFPTSESETFVPDQALTNIENSDECDRLSCLIIKAYDTVVAQFS